MRSCRGEVFTKKDAGLAPLPASRAAQTTASGSGFEPLPEGAAEPSAKEFEALAREWHSATGAQRVVIQGDGDPLAAADVVVDVLRLAAGGAGAKFRLNTLGLGATDAILEALPLVGRPRRNDSARRRDRSRRRRHRDVDIPRRRVAATP